MTQPANNDAEKAAILRSVAKVQADHELHRQKVAEASARRDASIAALEKWVAEREQRERTSAGTSASTVDGDGTLEVTAGGETFRITADGTIKKV